MKILIKCFFIGEMLLNCFSLRAQTMFCPPGAEWHYTFLSYFPYRIANEKIIYTGFSIEMNDTIKKLSHQRFFNTNNESNSSMTTSLKQIGDTVFMRNIYTSNDWQVLYNFAANQGDWWSNSFTETHGTIKYSTHIDSISQTNINGQNLKVMFVTMDNDIDGFGANPYRTKIIERVGCTDFLFNYFPIPNQSHDGWVKDFLCYEDNGFGTYQASTFPCDYTSFSGLGEANIETEIKLFPNPANQTINVRVVTQQEMQFAISVANQMGSELQHATSLGGETKNLNTSELAPGLYFLLIKHKQHLVGREKFVVVR